jgi:hypothetical protein
MMLTYPIFADWIGCIQCGDTKMPDYLSLLSTGARKVRPSELRELMKIIERPDMVSFAGGIPDPGLFPRAAYDECYRDALSVLNAPRSLQYAATEGYLPLREWIAEQMRSKGLTCTPDNILLTSGSQQGLELIGKLLINKGDRVCTSRPTYLGALQAFTAYEPAFDEVTGGSRDSSAKLLYVVPDFANPSGETMSAPERDALVSRAHRENSIIVEDAAYSSLRFEGADLPPIAALDVSLSGSIDTCRTLYCGTFSKTLSPGVRVGWVCGPRDLIGRLTLLKQGADLHSSTINQIATLGVAKACFEEHVTMLRGVYRARRDAMLIALSRYAPEGTAWTRPEGGLFIWLRLPQKVDASALFEEAVKRGLAFVPGAAFFPDEAERNTMRLSYSLNPEPVIDDGIRRICELISAAGDNGYARAS